MSTPPIAVILPVYNRASFVKRAIESVLAQTYRNFELIVVDDGSTDGTRAILEQFGSRITLLTQPNRGPSAARNLALHHARSELVAFIDSDDAWLPHRLQSQVPLMAREDVGVVFGNAAIVTPEKGRSSRTTFGITMPYRGRVADHFAWGNFVSLTTVLARRRCLEEIGGFDATAPIAGDSADYVTWFRVALRHEFDYVDEIVAEYTVHPGGISYDLGHSLEGRIALFSRELKSSADDKTRAQLRRLLFNLSLHLALAVLRGRAGSVKHPFTLARRTASSVTSTRSALWLAAFALHHASARGRRLFS